MENNGLWVPIVYSERQIKYDIEMKNHKNPIDIKTGEEMEMVSITLPNREYRSHRFGMDEKGIDRDSRKWRASIVIGRPFVYDNVNKKGDVISKFSYLRKDKEYTVHFSRLREKEGEKTEYPSPIKVKGQVLSDMFKESRMLLKLSKEEREAHIKGRLKENGTLVEGKKTSIKVPVR